MLALPTVTFQDLNLQSVVFLAVYSEAGQLVKRVLKQAGRKSEPGRGEVISRWPGASAAVNYPFKK